MDVGIVVIPSDQSAPITDLARAVEERGLGSLHVGGDHTHIPVRRTTPFPVAGELPEEYKRSIDPIVALAAAAAVTTRIRLGTCIYLTAQRDTIDTAKKIASLDHLSGGRVDFGIGYGWNVDEAEDHGVVWKQRRSFVREQVLAMKALWTSDEASFHGEFLDFDASWMWPKPLATPHPPVLIGASPGPKTFEAIIEWGDGWFPVPFWSHTPDDVVRLRQAASDAGRDPASLQIIVNGVMADPAQVEPWHAVGVDAVLVVMPTVSLDEALPVLDASAELLDHFRSR
jgi:probable F420-dependent oxidoreductase